VTRGVLLLGLALGACQVPYIYEGQNPVAGCALDKDCPFGSVCSAGACQFQARRCNTNADCDPDQICNASVCQDSNRGYCVTCVGNLDCDSGICAQLGDGGAVCGASCDDCPTGGSCQGVLLITGDDAGMACLPASGSC
jgi:hypothetical protein